MMLDKDNWIYFIPYLRRMLSIHLSREGMKFQNPQNFGNA